MEKQLLNRVKEAVEKNIGPDKVEDFVGVGATLNTKKSDNRAALVLADIGPDKRYQDDLPDLWRAKDVVYWVFEKTKTATSILGILWHENGRSRLFHGVVYPP